MSCYQEPVEDTTEVVGRKPIYLDLALTGTAISEEPKAFGSLGKIVSKDSYIYVNEKSAGIHVIDNANPSIPVAKHFWSIPGNIDFTIRENFLYADSGADLLTVDISDPADIKLVTTTEGIYNEDPEANFPINYSGPFECVDPSLGIVIAWESALITNPKCRI